MLLRCVKFANLSNLIPGHLIGHDRQSHSDKTVFALWHLLADSVFCPPPANRRILFWTQRTKVRIHAMHTHNEISAAAVQWKSRSMLAKERRRREEGRRKEGERRVYRGGSFQCYLQSASPRRWCCNTRSVRQCSLPSVRLSARQRIKSTHRWPRPRGLANLAAINSFLDSPPPPSNSIQLHLALHGRDASKREQREELAHWLQQEQ